MFWCKDFSRFEQKRAENPCKHWGFSFFYRLLSSRKIRQFPMGDCALKTVWVWKPTGVRIPLPPPEPWSVMLQGIFFISWWFGFHALALATTTYHKRSYKSRDYSGLYGMKLITFCVMVSLSTSYQFLNLEIVKAVGISAHRFGIRVLPKQALI